MENIYASLRPGGTAIVTVSSVAQIDPGSPDYWRLTPAGLGRLLDRALPSDAEREIRGFGNASTGSMSLQGLALHDVDPRVAHAYDPTHPVLAAARFTKPQ